MTRNIQQSDEDANRREHLSTDLTLIIRAITAGLKTILTGSWGRRLLYVTPCGRAVAIDQGGSFWLGSASSGVTWEQLTLDAAIAWIDGRATVKTVEGGAK